MRAITATIALAAFAVSLPAAAQDTREAEATAAGVAEALRNPAMQDAAAEGLAAASEAILDVPLAPLARAVAEASGQDPRDVDPNMTMRSASPDIADMPARVREEMPRMMGAMAGMAGGMGVMIPALRDMAERMRDVVDRTLPR